MDVTVHHEGLCDSMATQIHIIDDLCTELAAHKRTNAAAIDLLTDALHALRHGRTTVADEFVDRTLGQLSKLRQETARG